MECINGKFPVSLLPWLKKNGIVVISEGYVLNEYGKEVKVDENTLFFIASNLKFFTGTSIAKLDYKKNIPAKVAGMSII